MSFEVPILYSFRRCPYAIRARLAIKISNTPVELREVKLSNKPAQMLACSEKGTVPVLHLPDNSVIDESLDIMRWALSQNDPNNWLDGSAQEKSKIDHLIDINDNDFKQHLDHYKYFDRYPEHSMEFYRAQAEDFLKILENNLTHTKNLIKDTVSLADIAIFPFIRQFAYVDKDWFDQSEYKKLRNWLNNFLKSPLFDEAMTKFSPWNEGNDILIF